MTGDPPAAASAVPLTEPERAELDALRIEVARLRAERGSAAATGAGGLDPAGTGAPGGLRTGPRIAWLRWTACALLLGLAGLTAIGAVVARYVRGELLDTDRYLATVTPIAQSPAVRAQIVDTTTETVVDQLNIQATAQDALTALAEASPRIPPRIADRLPDLAPMIASGAENLVRRAVTQFVDSEQFQTLWIELNRAAHQNLDSVLTGEGDTAVQANSNGTVTLDLAPLIERVKQRLEDRGVAAAARIPTVHKTIVLFQSDDVVKAQRATAALQRAANGLPLVALVLAALAVWVAPRRRGALIAVGLAFAAAMIVLGLGITIGRSLYLNAVPGATLNHDAAVALIDPFLEPLRLALRAVLVFGLAVALGAWITGRGRWAVAARGGVAAISARARGANRTPTAFELWMGRYRRPLQAVAIAVGLLVLVSADYPSGATVTWIVLWTGLAVLVIYLLGAPVRPAPAGGPGPAPAVPTPTGQSGGSGTE